jgi:ABC-type sugar transport system ATPase subunit
VSGLAPPAVRFEGLSKSFPGVVALKDVGFEVAAGSCHALCGENGAGKSTLGRVLAGIHARDAGRLLVFGEEVRFASPRDARGAGIAIVHQELAFCENLSVAENLCLGALPARGLFVSRRELLRRAEQKLALIGAAIDARVLVGALTPGQQQMVQIAAAVSEGARIIVFDEPTSSLSQHEAEKLYRLIATLRAQGVTCLYVSHRLEEIFRLCDAVTVLRDGRHVATQATSSLDERKLVQLMIGRRLEEYFPSHVHAKPGAELLRVESLTSRGKFSGVSFSLRAGEVLGLAGLVGSGRSEIAQALFGLDPSATGEVHVEGRAARARSPREAMRLGIGLLPEDRKRQGLVLPMSALANTSLTILERLARRGFLQHARERELASGFFQRLRVRASSPEAQAAGLSGGNQQKLVLAKWLAAGSRVLILDEPTRGVDVQAKAEIHALIDELAAAGHGVLLISSELPEVLNLSTRILVLRSGRVAGELERREASQEAVMRLMAGVAA